MVKVHISVQWTTEIEDYSPETVEVEKEALRNQIKEAIGLDVYIKTHVIDYGHRGEFV